MYCSNCGNKVTSKDKFCSKCGAPIKHASTAVDKQLEALSKLNLFNGLEPWLANKVLNSYPLLAMKLTYDEYPLRYQSESKFLNFIQPDTKKIIFSEDIGGIIQTPLNQDEIENLTKEEKLNFDKYHPFLNSLRTDIIVIGYMYRLYSEKENSKAKLAEFIGVNTPQDYFKKIISSREQYPDPYADYGLGPTMGFVMGLGENDRNSVIETISNNVKKSNKIAKVYIFPDNSNFLMMLITGWCLARFDLYRKGKLSNISF